MPKKSILRAALLLIGLCAVVSFAEGPDAAEGARRPFTFLWMSDTQKLSSHMGEYEQVGAWVLGELGPRNVVCFLHTGDIVGVYKNGMQWERAHAALDPIVQRLPSLVIPGNHDILSKWRDYDPFRKNWYGEEAMAALATDETSYECGRGRYMLQTFGGIDFLFVGMGYDTTPEAMAWVEEVLGKYPDRIAVLMFHDYLHGNGRIFRRSQEQFDRMIAPYENVRLVLSGHHAGSFIRRDDFPSGRFTQSILMNMQDNSTRRGTVQFLTIDPEASTLSVYAWSPIFWKKPAFEQVIPIDLELR
ncbi:MAG: metallophosphoesterase [Clostridia bacterium]|nr:metallophosphoesterase [Clostridia bacterium]